MYGIFSVFFLAAYIPAILSCIAFNFNALILANLLPEVPACAIPARTPQTVISPFAINSLPG